MGFYLDVNDPRNQELLEKIKEEKLEQELKVSKKEIMMPLYNVKSIR